MCGKCHTNPAIMDKYGISTNVLNTYVADFHGTTVTLFEKQSPDQITNKPVCFDCHGVHNIAATNDPQRGLQVKANLLKACQKCHPDVTTETFTDAWLSHYIPSVEKYPIVYYVNLFYKFFIPAVLIPMAALVVMDFGRMLINRFRKPRRHVAPEPAAPPAPEKVEAVEASSPVEPQEESKPAETAEIPVEPVQAEEIQTPEEPEATEEAEPSESSQEAGPESGNTETPDADKPADEGSHND
jgi:hypothetical protein